jgi:hypothetical protein
MIERDEIVAVVHGYVERHPDEREHLRPLLDQLDTVLPITDRSAYPGHLTCSALVVDDEGRMLRIWHNVLGKWLQPGGHYHFDLRYAFRLPPAAEVTLQWDEVSGFQWTPIDEIRWPRIAAKLGSALRPHATARTDTMSAQPPVPRDRGRIGETRDLVDDDA